MNRQIVEIIFDGIRALGRNREFFIIVCKKWRVAKWVVEKCVQMLRCLWWKISLVRMSKNYLNWAKFIQSTKKARQRRALVRMFYEYYKTENLAICLDPSNIYLISDFASDRNTTRILEIHCEFDDQYILGHARRISLISDHNAVETLVKLQPSIKNDLKKEIGSIGDLKLEFAYKINEKGVVQRNTNELSRFAHIMME